MRECRIRSHFPVVLLMLLLFSACSSGDPKSTGTDKPKPNPFLASSLYAITHFDPSQSDSTPYGPPRNSFTSVDLRTKPIVYGGPVNIITVASTNANYMWQVGTDRVSYVYKGDGQWSAIADYQALDYQSGGAYPAISDTNFRTFGEASAVGMDVASMDTYLRSLFGSNYSGRFGNAFYVLVDNNNVLYTNYGTSLYGFALTDPADPSAGITIRYALEDIINKIQGSSPPGARLFGLAMTYDGHLIVTFSNGVAVIDRDLNPASSIFFPFSDTEMVTNSVAVDENNGIYVATGPALGATPGSSTMYKLVWTGAAISDKESDGAWSCPYDNSLPEMPPMIKVGAGTGSTPTLMGFRNDPDKLVVITDGAKRMKLVAFWRDAIPDDFVQKAGTASRRIAGQIDVTCGFSPLPEWIQSEQSVVVYRYGAFVVNNIPQVVSPEIASLNKILQMSLMGPAYPSAYGVQRFEWDPSVRDWYSVWARSDVSSTSMVPVHSESSGMALINGYTPEDGWQVLGMDWNWGTTVHQTKFGDINFGNGAYAILQYLENGDLLFNSFSGPLRVEYGS